MVPGSRYLIMDAPFVRLSVGYWVVLSTLVTAESLRASVIEIPDLGGRDHGFPPKLQVSVTSHNARPHRVLQLEKSTTNLNAPVFRICGNKKSRHLCTVTSHRQNEAFYRDTDGGASLSVLRHKKSNGHYTNTWTGFVLLDGQQYELQGELNSTPHTTRYELTHTPEQTGPADFVLSNEIPSNNTQPRPFTKRKRLKRQNGNFLAVELLIVIDNVIYQKWYSASKAVGDAARSSDTDDNLRRYFAHVVNGMDLRYRAIKDSRFQITVTLVGYILAQGDVTLPSFASGSTRVSVNADTALETFRDWVRDMEGLPAYDHVMLFTGHDIYTSKGGNRYDSVTGLAYLGLICTPSSVSLVEYHGGFSSSRIATHELGHSLGASHDGDGNSCRSTDQYIMTGKAQPSKDAAHRTNPWTFSPCSLNAFATMVARLKYGRNRRCLFDSPSVFNVNQWKRYMKQQPGQWFSVDDVCRQFLGPTSYMCRDLIASQSDICTALWCHRPNTNQCRQHIAPRGTSCGNGKWCINGNCVRDQAAPVKPDNCVHGDHPGVVHKGRSCSEIVTSEPYYCYQEYIQKRCCAICSRYYVPMLGCEYGNRQKKCPKIWCSHRGKQRSKILSQCCGTCGVGTPITRASTPLTTRASTPLTDRASTPLTDVDTPIFHSSIPTRYTTRSKCADLSIGCQNSAKLHPAHCYLPSFEHDCCESCQNIRSPHSNCFYGDRDTTHCHNVTYKQCVTNSLIVYNCCATCASLKSDISTGSVTSRSSIFIVIVLLTTSSVTKLLFII